MESLLDSIQKKIRETPTAVAVIYEGRPFTYQELEEQSNRLSHYLAAHHVVPGDNVVFLMRRSFDMLATMLAIWKLGAVYVPLDLKIPPARIRCILKQVDPRCIVSEPAFLSRLPRQSFSILTLSDPAYESYSEKFDVQAIENRGKTLAYIIYTSGSTGEPKGVMISHGNLVNHVTWLNQKFQFSHHVCFSFNSSIAFDFSVACTVLPLSVGAKIVITREEESLNIKQYCEQLVENRVSFAKWTPSFFKLLLDYVETQRPDFSAFKFIMLGGEELLTHYLGRWFSVYPNHSMINEYGPTEATVGITTHVVTQATLNKTLRAIPIGKPAINTDLYIVTADNKIVKEGEVGELLIGGKSVAQGYYRQPELTAERFIDPPFLAQKQKLYKTGDLVKRLPGGDYFYVGRIDHQIKIDGYRVELGDIEQHILQQDSVKHVVVIPEKNSTLLTAYIVFKEKASISFETLKKYLMKRLPEFMIPKKYYAVTQIPLNKNSKIDYAALREYVNKPEAKTQKPIFFSNSFVKLILDVLNDCVTKENIDIHTPLFSQGMTSLLAAQVIDKINQKCGGVLKIQDLFLYPTVSSLADYLEINQQKNVDISNNFSSTTSENHRVISQQEPIAIVAMECRLPGADNCEAYWDLCRDGNERITFFKKEKLKKSIHENLHEHPVYARGIINDVDYFDADFFNFSPKEAHLCDPQHRLLLELAWVAFEKAGYVPDRENGNNIGVFASMNESTYLIDHHLAQLGQNYFKDRFSPLRSTSSQFLATKVAYHLNCTGPSFTLQTACSTSLVAVALACQQLSGYHCDMALAGGISIITPQDAPYRYQRGNIFSPDGHCRPFDANAAGTVFSNGVGLVVLKRLSDALRDNDTILSVIKGVGVNNDGHQKMSYMAPSLQGQAACIASAQKAAGIDINTIGYLETHGTGTLIGDPIEIEALTRVFRTHTSREQYCALGSVKANIGHTHVAAGVAGLIKTVLALRHQQIPPIVHCDQLNPHIDFDHSPFYVNTRLQKWRTHSSPRRAAVSAFGVGGTNAHVILEEAPEQTVDPAKREYAILLLSTKTKKALQNYQDRLIHFFENNTIVEKNATLLADVAYTLQQGRKSFPYRTGIVCKDATDAIHQLTKKREDIASIIPQDQTDNPQRLFFLFPGQGTQYVNLTLALYNEEEIYREHLDYCFDQASRILGCNIKKILFPDQKNIIVSEEKIHQTEFTHPILFSVEYALAQLLMHWGIQPDAMLGHSLGEYVAACLSGVFSVEEAIQLACARGLAIAKCEKGAMLSVSLSKNEALSFCHDTISLAAINSDNSCVFSGTESAIQMLHRKLQSIKEPNAISMQRLKTQYPFHSSLLAPAIDDFQTALKTIQREAPRIPYLSNVTGEWITESDVKSDQYWVDHLLKAVQFSRGTQRLIDYPNALFAEIGPGQTLLSLVQQHTSDKIKSISFLPSAKLHSTTSANQALSNGLKSLWCYGYSINWKRYYDNEKRRRIPLPTYPFQKKRYWFDKIIPTQQTPFNDDHQETDIKFYTPTWIRDSNPLKSSKLHYPKQKSIQWIVFDDESALSKRTIRDLKLNHQIVIVVQAGGKFNKKENNYFTLNPKENLHYDQFVEYIKGKEREQYHVIHFWLVGNLPFERKKNLLDSLTLYKGIYSGLFLTQSFYRHIPHAVISCVMVVSELHTVLGNETINPLKSTLLSLSRVLPLETKNVRVNVIDIDPVTESKVLSLYSSHIINTLLTQDNSKEHPITETIAYRNRYCWRQSYHTFSKPERKSEMTLRIVKNGVYFITGGLGGMGLTIAEWLSKKAPITLLLLSRSLFPHQADWEKWRETHSVEDVISQKIKRLKAMMHRGCSVVIESANVGDEDQVQEIITKIEKHYGKLKGIFHCAGLPGKGLAVLKDQKAMHDVLLPKIQGMWVLARLFQHTKLDFVVCASSLTAIVGGIGQIDYCAANLFMDYFLAQNPFKHCKKLLIINWNSWSSVGMAVNLQDSKIHEKFYQDNSVTPNEAVSVLERLINVDNSQVIVSRLSPRKEINRIITFFNKIVPAEETHLDKKNHPSQEGLNISEELESIWKEILGREVIHSSDTFYSLGGDSLSAIQLQMAVEKRFHITLSLQDLSYEHTIHSLSTLIESRPIHSDNILIPLMNTDNRSLKALKKQKTQIYFIHPLGGTVFCYFPFKHYLKTQFPCYAIQDPEVMKGETLFDSIKEMALHYVNHIVEQPKTENVILIGYSFGGNLAIEMTPFLEKKGITVEKILLLDSWANLGKTNNRINPQLPFDDDLKSLKVIQKYYGKGSYQYRVIERRLDWLRQYTPTTVHVPVILFKASNLLPLYKAIATEDQGWEEHCSDSLVQYKVKGSHETMLKPCNLQNLCYLLNKYL